MSTDEQKAETAASTTPAPAAAPTPTPVPAGGDLLSKLAPVLDQAPPEAQDFIRTHGKTLVVAALAALVAFVGSSAYRNYRASAASEAEKLLFGKTPQEVEQVVNQHGGTPVAPLALITLASMRYDEGRHDEALNLFTKFIRENKAHPMLDRAELNIGLCQEASGKLDEALATYRSFADKRKDSFLYPESVFGQARCLEQQGKFPEAKAVYEDFIAANPESTWRERAEAALPYLERTARAGGLPKAPAVNPLQFNLPTAPSLPVPAASPAAPAPAATPSPAPAP